MSLSNEDFDLSENLSPDQLLYLLEAKAFDTAQGAKRAHILYIAFLKRSGYRPRKGDSIVDLLQRIGNEAGLLHDAVRSFAGSVKEARGTHE